MTEEEGRRGKVVLRGDVEELIFSNLALSSGP